ncbi:MAG TPA: universal stress protein [Armatimonadota bacterium]|nr:universal stress protein [Armatimonadota bacterium]
MYRKVLVALDNTAADRSLLPHVRELARLTGAELLLVHVATGFAAQWRDQLRLEESREMQEDRAYLERAAETLRAEGLHAGTALLLGDPPTEILRLAQREGCDLIAMTTHGHRFIADFLLGSTIDKVRHATDIPLLVVRAAPG